MIGYYNYSVILTYLGLSSAVVGIARAFCGDVVFAMICLLVCGLCDMFDGSIAQTCKRTEDAKSFGVQIDSLCDMVCFGVFPAVLCYAVCPEKSWYLTVSMCLYVLAGIIRLGYFNVQEMNRKQHGEGKRRYYEGLPITTSALIMPLVIALDGFFGFSAQMNAYLYPLLLLAVGFLQVSKLHIRKPYLAGQIILTLLGVGVLLLVIAYGGNALV